MANVTLVSAVKIEELTAALAPYLPPAIGALAGLPYAQNQTPAQKLMSFGIGCAAGYYLGGAVAEYFSLQQKGSIACGFLFGAVGYDAMLFIIHAARNPLQSFKDWWAVWRGGQS